eukprot:TRINITY_DN136_c0_g2_i1.p1 TRINITY_DN136_c0_g2~~TRINITY_DN136_c0_g2_i1.p1  ORF type:complete len:377 (-),score=44.72 TRINITY_DN136_c0_g2_i1:600-1592(-)
MKKHYRNDIDEVAVFLNSKYADNYLVINLTHDRYDQAKFNNQVKCFSFPDHHPPPISLYLECVQTIYNWINGGPSRVIVVHCKAGRGRTGVAICGYFLYAGLFDTSIEAIKYFNKMRSKEGQNLVLPSQKRYVEYFEQIIKCQIQHEVADPPTYLLKRIIIDRIVPIEGGKKVGDIMYMGASCNPWIYVEDSQKCTEEKKEYLAQLNYRSYTIAGIKSEHMSLDVDTLVKGDIQISMLHKSTNMPKFTMSLAKLGYSALCVKEMVPNYPYITLFRYSLNTYFLGRCAKQSSPVFSVKASELDPVCVWKEKKRKEEEDPALISTVLGRHTP